MCMHDFLVGFFYCVLFLFLYQVTICLLAASSSLNCERGRLISIVSKILLCWAASNTPQRCWFLSSCSLEKNLCPNWLCWGRSTRAGAFIRPTGQLPRVQTSEVWTLRAQFCTCSCNLTFSSFKRCAFHFFCNCFLQIDVGTWQGFFFRVVLEEVGLA